MIMRYIFFLFIFLSLSLQLFCSDSQYFLLKPDSTAKTDMLNYGTSGSDINYNYKFKYDQIKEKPDVYPVPATDHINIRLFTNTLKPVLINIFDAIGKKVFTKKVPLHYSGKQIIKVSGFDLNPGLYYLHIQYDEQTYCRRITIS